MEFLDGKVPATFAKCTRSDSRERRFKKRNGTGGSLLKRYLVQFPNSRRRSILNVENRTRPIRPDDWSFSSTNSV